MKQLLLIGLGSNVGNREKQIRESVERIQRADIQFLALSPIYESEPWGVDHQTSYLNAVAAFSTQLQPDPILIHLQSIEKQMGRTSKSDLKPRSIDLDVLAYGNEKFTRSNFEIPHPRMMQRRFVLQPLLSICPFWMHPVSGKTPKEMLDTCGDASWIKPWKL